MLIWFLTLLCSTWPLLHGTSWQRIPCLPLCMGLSPCENQFYIALLYSTCPFILIIRSSLNICILSVWSIIEERLLGYVSLYHFMTSHVTNRFTHGPTCHTGYVTQQLHQRPQGYFPQALFNCFMIYA